MDEGRNEPGPEVVAGLRAGDEGAARQFFRQLHPFVLKIVRNHRPAHQSEEDLCQMIFLKAFSKISQYSGQIPVSH
ncbi:MAG TPA: sigma factor, partial [Terrimicrobiaceae bacterium]|nr:sigma factor [Terrimicrobiaceae bacterium]